MTDDKLNHPSDKQPSPEKRPLNSPDAVDAANAGAQEIKQVEASRTNRHTGSAGGDPDASVEIDFGDGRKSSRAINLTEHQAANLAPLQGHADYNELPEQRLYARMAALPAIQCDIKFLLMPGPTPPAINPKISTQK